MGFRRKTYDEQLDEELKEKFDEKERTSKSSKRSDKKRGGKKDKGSGKSEKKDYVPPPPVFPKPVYDSPWKAKLTIVFMFMILWFLVFAIAMAVAYSFGISTFSWMFMLVITTFLIIFNVIIYYMSDRMVLRAYNARIIKEKDNPRLYNAVKDIAMRADLPMPRVAIVPSSTPNAFATGRNPQNAVVAATEGLLDILDDDELEGVIAHEMAHVKNRDILVMSIASTAAMIIAFAARIIFFQMIFGRGRGGNWPLLLLAAITAPIAAILVQFAISRSREYKADRIGAITIQKPLALADALEKLESGNRLRPMKSGDPATSSLFIVNPFRGSSFATLFSTHPPIKKRISRLRKMHEDFSYL
jgi:heat shock protein HtpX